MMPLPVRWLPCLLLALMPLLRAEPVDMLFRNWTSRDGLPQDHIRAMVQTRDGFLWLGTDAGLARFDGSEFKTYGLREGLGAVAVMSLLEADDGALWIGTLGGGVSVLRNGRIEKTYPQVEGLSAAATPELQQDADGNIWVSGAFRLEGDRFVKVPGARGSARRVFRDREGVLWVGYFDYSISRWKDGKWEAGSGAGGPTTLEMCCEDGQGRLWIADASRKLWCREAAGWKSWPLRATMSSRPSSLAAAADGTVWIAFFREGILGFRDGEFIEPRTEGGKFLDLSELVFTTPGGLLWMGSSTNGLYSLVPRRITLATLDDPAANRGANFIGALAEIAPGSFMVGTQGHGLFRWKQGITEPVTEWDEVNRGLNCNALLRVGGGFVWSGTGHGLHKFKEPPDGKPVPQMLSNIWEICEDGKGSIWAGGGNGNLYHLRDGEPVPVDYSGSGSVPIKGLARATDGALWIGTRGNGLFRLKDGEPRRFGIADGLGSEVIRVVHAAEDGSVWVGTAGGGLSFWRDGRFVTVTTADGLPDDIVSQISQDAEDRLWVGTNRGLAVIEKDEAALMKEGRVPHLHPLVINGADGLVSEECTIVPPVAMGDGRMAFATTHGFAMLRPEEFQPEKATPPVFIERIHANGKIVEPVDGKLTLSPGLERLEIEFTGLHFAAPKRLQFRNRLAGLEDDWGSPGIERHVEYRNLAPGDYRFELAGSIGNGLWSPQPAVLDITLAPYFWQTAGFKVAAAIAALGAVATFARWRERLHARRKIEELKREQAVQSERARIARDLHDDVGASLTQVALLSELADSDLSDNPELAREHINEIFTTAKDVTRSLDEIVWAVNPAQDTLEGFAAFLGTFVQNYARSAGLTGRLDIPEKLPAVPLTSAIRHHLYLATKEALHNVVKHAGATEIRLRLFPEGGRLRLVIEDNGRGLDEASRGEGDGLDNFRKRLDQIGGTCTHRSAPGQGTSVQMIVPLVM